MQRSWSCLMIVRVLDNPLSLSRTSRCFSTLKHLQAIPLQTDELLLLLSCSLRPPNPDVQSAAHLA